MSTRGATNLHNESRPAKPGRRGRAWTNAAIVAAFTLALGGCATDGINAVTNNADWRAGSASHDIVVGGVQRSFILHVPPSFAGNTTDLEGSVRSSFPLMLVLHGSSGSGEAIRESSQMDSLSDAMGFLVAYPNASDGGFGLYPTDWNAGTCCGVALRESVDDLAFISALIANISAQLPVDPQRVYIAGFSDGGRMAYHAACQLASKIAAIAVVSGSLTDDACFPGLAVPLLAIHGTADDQVAYSSDAATPAPGPVPDMALDLPSSVQFWIAANGCTDGSNARFTEHVTETRLSPCIGGDVVLYTVDGGTHGWPGEPGSDGPMSEFHASSLIAQFFARQVRR